MIIPAIHSRCQGFHITTQDQVDFTARIAEILLAENVSFEIENLDTYVKATYPDLRKTINTVQMNVVDNVLKAPEQEASGGDWKINMVALFRENKIREARKLITQSARPDEYNEIFKFLYRNLEFFGANEDQQDEAVIVIRNGMVKHTQVADPEINLSATMIELEQIGR
jgi:DNA polymerase III delta prime subunit